VKEGGLGGGGKEEGQQGRPGLYYFKGNSEHFQGSPYPAIKCVAFYSQTAVIALHAALTAVQWLNDSPAAAFRHHPAWSSRH